MQDLPVIGRRQSEFLTNLSSPLFFEEFLCDRMTAYFGQRVNAVVKDLDEGGVIEQRGFRVGPRLAYGPCFPSAASIKELIERPIVGQIHRNGPGTRTKMIGDLIIEDPEEPGARLAFATKGRVPFSGNEKGLLDKVFSCGPVRDSVNGP